MDDATLQSLNSGSRWFRWEPHIHAPGTVLNDRFKGDTAWEDYLAALNSAVPPIRAIGVTDYYSIETYERVRQAQADGHLPGCDLVFPNIEMRLGIGTTKGGWVNIHLLVSPEDADHVDQLKRFLGRLQLKAHGDTFCCNREDLIRLGQKHDQKKTEPLAALEAGSEQFKVSLDELKQIYTDSGWAKKNIIIAVAASEHDGTSGVREGADATLRQEIEKFAHVIFASSPAQRRFWLGQGAASLEVLWERYGGPKPCMHGSDAHEAKKVGVPDADRYSWIKGALKFDTLLQACIDPETRAFVGTEPPIAATQSQVIRSIEITGAPWAQTPTLALNPGLVAIIGARGSGKTALADIIALGCEAATGHLNKGSFLYRAQSLLGGARVALTWESGDVTEAALDQSDSADYSSYPRARYLSQQFVEELCSADGMTDELMAEIERVIFEAHPLTERDGTVDFPDLLDLHAERHREARRRDQEALSDLSEQIGAELEKDKLVDGLKRQIAEKERVIASHTRDRAKLISKGSESRIARLGLLTVAAEAVRGNVRYFNTRAQALLTLQDEVRNFRSHQAPDHLRRSKEKHRTSGIDDSGWDNFLLNYTGDVDAALKAHLEAAQTAAKDWKGEPIALTDPNRALIADDADLSQEALATLEAEIDRLQKLVSVDRDTASKFATLSGHITTESTALQTLKDKLVDYEGAKERARALAKERQEAYTRVFTALAEEQGVLVSLYRPLMDRLVAASGTVKQLSFSVRREVDVAGWAAEGERLIDLRTKGPFQGRGKLAQLAATSLLPVWQGGDPASISAAMAKFRSDVFEDLFQPVPKGDQTVGYREWAKNFAKWLYSTEHIALDYSIDYDGVDIRKLSPGTRGIVLLLLYLALDDTDDRPLIIDQPEENLDPKSVFDELVSLFLQAKSKRQVIIVTHNANLVINTDADQIIIAEAGAHPPGELPPITYLSGGLESVHIRIAVCNILEGGEQAFKERARRLRVRLDR